ncbi:hypothetical protein I4U23_002943 [Adineta vaga]|nr:hypothetical protein I4U23_002943 [Adineta vaga]
MFKRSFNIKSSWHVNQNLIKTTFFFNRQRATDVRQPILTVDRVEQNSAENLKYISRFIYKNTIAQNTANGTLGFDEAEFDRLPNKQTELQITDEILNDVARVLENYLENDEFLSRIRHNAKTNIIAAQFKDTQMKTSLLSPAIIEAALTIIIKQINDEHTINNERYVKIKQLPFIISYKDVDNELFYTEGIRLFHVERKQPVKEE